MLKLANYIFDAHDDLDGRVLRTLLPQPEQVPAFIKTAERREDQDRAALPDTEFALVMFEEGHKLRKYAMYDKGNTALSVLYLGHQSHLLPPEAVKIAATNLLAGCAQHELAVPTWLKIAAEVGISGVSGKAQKPYAKGAKVIKINPPFPVTPRESIESPQLGVRSDDQDLLDRTNYAGVAGENFKELPAFSQKEKQTLDSTGVEKRAEDRWGARVNLDVEHRTKHEVVKVSPYVDVSGWNPEAYAVEDHRPPENTLLDGHYPVDGMDQVKLACTYFDENWKNFHPRDRHTYCVKLAARIGELGMAVPETVARYGSEEYSADTDELLRSRRGLVDNETFGPALDTLLEKRAQLDPGTFAEAVAEFDQMTGLRYFWDAQVPDPWYTTFGPSREKLAAAEWTYNEGGTRVTQEDLDELALNHRLAVKKQFGQEFAERFGRSPRAAFDSLAKPAKLVLARLASDRWAGTIGG